MRMTEIWRASIPGHTAHTALADPASKSLFVSDGWGVAYPALRLHRLDPETGEKLAEVRTRRQHVSALVAAEDSLYVATHSRLLRLRPEDLRMVGQWDRVLPSDSQQLVACGQLLVAANRRKPAVGLFDPDSGASVRLNVGLQPLVFVHAGNAKVAEGFQGGIRTFDFERRCLLGAEPGPPLAAVAAGEEIWGIGAEAPTAGGGSGPASAWSKPGTERLLRVGDGEEDRAWSAWLPAPGVAVYCDDERGLVWCLVGPDGATLVAVSQEERRLVQMFPAGTGRYWVYFDPVSGLALAAQTADDGEGYRPAQSVSTLSAHLVVDD